MDTEREIEDIKARLDRIEAFLTGEQVPELVWQAALETNPEVNA